MRRVNPIWLYGPYSPVSVSSLSQPDWYIGFLEGSLRLMPGLETNVAGHTIAWNVFLPAVALPAAFFLIMGVYPFAEQWVTGDKRYHLVLDRPRNVPARTGAGVAIAQERAYTAVSRPLSGQDRAVLQTRQPEQLICMTCTAG